MKNYQHKYENGGTIENNDSLLQEIKNTMNNKMDKINNKLEMIMEQQKQDKSYIK